MFEGGLSLRHVTKFVKSNPSLKPNEDKNQIARRMSRVVDSSKLGGRKNSSCTATSLVDRSTFSELLPGMFSPWYVIGPPSTFISLAITQDTLLHPDDLSQV